MCVSLCGEKAAEKGAQRVEFSDDDNHFVVSSDSDYHTSEGIVSIHSLTGA